MAGNAGDGVPVGAVAGGVLVTRHIADEGDVRIAPGFTTDQRFVDAKE